MSDQMINSMVDSRHLTVQLTMVRHVLCALSHFKCSLLLDILCCVCDRVQEDHPIMSFVLNDSGQLALINVATQVCDASLLTCYYWGSGWRLLQ